MRRPVLTLLFSCMVLAGCGSLVVPYEVRTTPNRATVRFGDYRLQFESLAPYPFSSLPAIRPGDYRATFKLTSALSS